MYKHISKNPRVAKNLLFLVLLMLLLFLKTIIYLYINFHGYQFFGGGNDSEYYDSYALGYTDNAVNIWPVLLRWLNEINFYSRSGVSYALAFLGILAIPAIIGNLCIVKNSPIKKKIFLFSFFVASCYPTIFFYTFDIYRDLFMVFCFLFGLFLLKNYINQSRIYRKAFLFFLLLLLSGFLYLLRPYLGFGFVLMVIGGWFFKFEKFSWSLLFFGLVIILQCSYSFGLLDPIIKYRQLFFSELTGGSNFGLHFSSSYTFLADLFKSFLYQIFGLYFISIESIAVFILESVPFIFFCVYFIKNKKYSDPFVNHLFIFFVAYTMIWLLGNDNLGSAIRLRMFSYISIYIACVIIYQNKIIFLENRSPS